MKVHRDWRSVPMPPRIASLPTDARGYPIPFVVARGIDGTPLFTINDHRLLERCIREHLCGVCGTPLTAGDLCFVGGPLSAFHPQGGLYSDGPIHHECAHYALQVCPYLAAPKYVHRIDAAKAHEGNVNFQIAVDGTVMPDRPDFFIMIRSFSFLIEDSGLVRRYRPQSFGNTLGRFHDFELWRRGRRIVGEGTVRTLVRDALGNYGKLRQQRPKVFFVKPGYRSSDSEKSSCP